MKEGKPPGQGRKSFLPSKQCPPHLANTHTPTHPHKHVYTIPRTPHAHIHTMYTCTHTIHTACTQHRYTHSHLHVHTHNTHPHTHVHTPPCTDNTHIYICTHMYTCIHTHVHTNRRTHIPSLTPGPYASPDTKISPNSYFNSQITEEEQSYSPNKSRKRSAGLRQGKNLVPVSPLWLKMSFGAKDIENS